MLTSKGQKVVLEVWCTSGMLDCHLYVMISKHYFVTDTTSTVLG